MGSRIRRKTGIGIKGAFRINIKANGELVGDSGWKGNVVTAGGITRIMSLLRGSTSAGIDPAATLLLGTGGTAAYTATDLPSYVDPEVGTVTIATAVSSGAASTDYHTLRFTGTFATGWNTAAQTINNVGLYDSDGSGGLFFAGNTYASSPCATNQSVEVTYDIKMGGQ